MSEELGSILAAGARSGTASALEEQIFQALSLAASEPQLQRSTGSGVLDLASQPFERGDVRGLDAGADDGGERLSTAPSANELNGNAQAGLAEPSAEALIRGHQRQWQIPVAELTNSKPEGVAHLLDPAGSAAMPVAASPTGPATPGSSSLFGGGDVHDGQSGSVSGWGSYREHARTSTQTTDGKAPQERS